MRSCWINIAAVTHSPKNTLFNTTKNYDFEIFFKEEYWEKACSKNGLVM